MDDDYLFYNTEKPFNVSTTHHLINTLLQFDDELRTYTNGTLSLLGSFPDSPLPVNLAVAATKLRDATSANLDVVLCQGIGDCDGLHVVYRKLFRVSVRQFSKFTEYHADKFPDGTTKLTAKSNVEWRSLFRNYLRGSNFIPALTYGMITKQ